MRYIRTEDGVVHLPSLSNGDLGQPLCYEPWKRLPPRGSATATEDVATCGDCHRRSIDTARAELEQAIRDADRGGLTQSEIIQLTGLHRDTVAEIIGVTSPS